MHRKFARDLLPYTTPYTDYIYALIAIARIRERISSSLFTTRFLYGSYIIEFNVRASNRRTNT